MTESFKGTLQLHVATQKPVTTMLQIKLILTENVKNVYAKLKEASRIPFFANKKHITLELLLRTRRENSKNGFPTPSTFLTDNRYQLIKRAENQKVRL